jgi:hypothetical protein
MNKSIEFVGGSGDAGTVSVETVSDILERELQVMIKEWLFRVDQEPDLARIPLNFQDRTGHLPNLLHDVIARLRLDVDTKRCE